MIETGGEEGDRGSLRDSSLANSKGVRMKNRTVSLLTGIAAALLICVMARAAAAEMLYDPQHYRDLVDTSSSQTIPPGTKITLQNWKQYKNFMPVWLQAAYSGDYHW